MSNLTESISVQRWVMGLLGGLTPISIVAGAFYIGSIKTDMENRMFDSPRQKEKVISRAYDETVHMSYKDKTIEFVPRSEIQYKLDVRDQQYKDIKQDLKDIKNALNIK